MKFSPIKSNRWLPARRGAASLLVVVMLCGVILIAVASFLVTLSTKNKLDYRATLRADARNGAEGMAEFALAELDRRATSLPSLGAPTVSPLNGYSLPAADFTFMAPGTGNNHLVSSGLEYKAGLLSPAPSAPMLIDANDPSNAADLSNGMTLSVRSMNIFGKATAQDPANGTTISQYVAEHVQVREQAWFNYAIFYNMDMEFHAGPDFDVRGPVFTNADVYATEGSGNTLNFYASLTAFHKIYRYDKYTGNNSLHDGTVKCVNAAGSQVAMTTAQDSTDTNWYTDADNNWNKKVQDSAFSVTKFNPPGLPAYVPEDFSTGTVELRNNAALMIEPQLSTRTTDSDFGQKVLAAENLKFSALSGFVIQVLPPDSTQSPPTMAPSCSYDTSVAGSHKVVSGAPKWRLVVYQQTDTSTWLSIGNLPARDVTTGKPIVKDVNAGVSVLPSATNACTIDPFNDQDEVDLPGPYTTPATRPKIKRALKKALLEAIVAIPYQDNGASTTAGTSTWGTGAANLKSWSQAAGIPFLAAGAYYPIYDRREGYLYPGNGTSATDGLKGAMHVLRIDLGKLKVLMNDATGLWDTPAGSAAATTKVYDVATNWSGTVYVQFPLAPIDLTRFPTVDGGTGPTNADRIRPAVAPNKVAGTPGYALLLANGTQLPQLAGPGTTSADGFTVATNGPAYILGHFNADGDSTTGSSTAPDSTAAYPTNTEVPAMIAADAVTILSLDKNFKEMWKDSASINAWTNSSGNNVGNNNSAGSNRGATGGTAFTEVSAAIVTGVVPTRPGTGNIWAGGVHNLVRYLEDWGGATYRYRGSLAALYESEVAKSPYREGYEGYWYSPPTRNMGYHQYLSQGRFPPSTPIVRTVRRMSLDDITAAVYNAGPSQPPASN